jgi:hypothetical protein
MATAPLTSCDRKYDEGDVMAAASTLIKSSEKLNKLFWGEGLEYTDDLNYADGAYRKATFASLDEFGIKTVEDIKNLARGTFSTSYCETIFSTLLSSVSDSDGIQLLARYSKRGEGDEETVYVYTEWEPFLTSEVIYLYDTLKVDGSEEETVYVSIDCIVKNSEGKEQRKTLRIGLLEEPTGWRLDSPTYATYNPKE